MAFEKHAACLQEEGVSVLTKALGRGGWFADVFFEQSVYHTGAYRLDANRRQRPFALQRDVMEGTSVRVLTETDEHVATVDAVTPRAWHQAAADVATHRNGEATVRPVAFHQAFQTPALPPDAPDAISETEKQALMRETAEAVWAFDDRVHHASVHYHDHTRRTALVTSDGKMAVCEATWFGLRISVTLHGKNGVVTGDAIGGSTGGFGHFFHHPPERLAQAAVAQAQHRAEARPLKAGPRPVVIAAGWGGAWLHETIGHTLEADVMADHGLGEPVAAPEVTLVDDATVPDARGAFPVDDEGTPAQRTPLIQNGMLCGFLTDRRRAHRYGLPCTGNGRRQHYRHAPLPRMTNLLLEPGTVNPADLMADINDGLFVQKFGQGQVWPDGTFSLTVREGFRIENGHRTHPVTNVVVQGKGWESLRNIAGIGNDFVLDTARGQCKKNGQVVPVSVGMPTVLLTQMEVVPHADS